MQLGYSGDGEADELVDRAEAEVYGVTERRVAEDYAPLSEIMPGALDEIEAIGSRGGGADRRPHRLRRPGRPDQRPAPGTDDSHRRTAGHRQGAGARHAAADARGLDHDGRDPGGRLPPGRGREAHPSGRRDRDHDRPPVLRGGVQRRHGHRGRRRPSVAHHDSGQPPPALGRAGPPCRRVGQEFRVLMHTAEAVEVGLAEARIPVQVSRAAGGVHVLARAGLRFPPGSARRDGPPGGPAAATRPPRHRTRMS